MLQSCHHIYCLVEIHLNEIITCSLMYPNHVISFSPSLFVCVYATLNPVSLIIILAINYSINLFGRSLYTHILTWWKWLSYLYTVRGDSICGGDDSCHFNQFWIKTQWYTGGSSIWSGIELCFIGRNHNVLFGYVCISAPAHRHNMRHTAVSMIYYLH